MKVQKSFTGEYTGILYVVGTPIGNLEDLSLRAKDTLQRVDVIAAEDTRHTGKMLSRLEISKPLVSYHQHNQKSREQYLVKRLLEGESIALVTDAGMPTISDPGELLIKRLIHEGIPVVPIPGPVASLTALVASGLPSQPFIFIGFLPKVPKQRVAELHKWRELAATLLFYESPHRLLGMIQDVLDVFGDREVVIAREITKKNEEWFRGQLTDCISYLQDVNIRGEFTIVVSPYKDIIEPGLSDEDIIHEIDTYVQEGLTKKEAISKVAQDNRLSKNEIYRQYHLYLNDKE